MVTSRQYGVYVAVEISCTSLKQEGKKKTFRSLQTLLGGSISRNHFSSCVLVFTCNEMVICDYVQAVGWFVVANIFLTEMSR